MISSVTNKTVQRIAAYASRGRARRDDGAFVIEGIRMLREAPRKDIREVYVTEGFMSGKLRESDRSLMESLSRDSNVVFETVADIVMNRMADTKTPQGVLAVVGMSSYSGRDVFPADETGALLLLLEDIRDPGNMGTIFRTAEAAGVSGIVMSKGCADVYSPKVVRSTMGAIFRVPFIQCGDLYAYVKELSDKGIKVYAAAMDAASDYDRCDLREGSAFLIGNEGAGLSPEVRDAAPYGIRIPMCGEVESLNAAITASVLVFEAARQRRQKPV